MIFCVQGSKKEDGSSSSSSIPSMPAKVWQPGVDKLEEGEELQCDASAYNSLHAFHIGWPCLRCFEFSLFSVFGYWESKGKGAGFGVLRTGFLINWRTLKVSN